MPSVAMLFATKYLGSAAKPSVQPRRKSPVLKQEPNKEAVMAFLQQCANLVASMMTQNGSASPAYKIHHTCCWVGLILVFGESLIQWEHMQLTNGVSEALDRALRASSSYT